MKNRSLLRAGGALAAAALGAADTDELVLDWVLDGGEDHGLLGTFPPDVTVPEEFTIIGTIRDGRPGEVFVNGQPRTPGGWDSARGAN